MSSLQTVLRLGTRRWSRMIASLRNNSDNSRKVVLNTSLSHSVCYCRNQSNVCNLQDSAALQKIVMSEVDAQNENPDVADKHTNQFVEAVDEVPSAARSQMAYSNTFVRTCQHLLTDWSRQVKELQNDKLPVNLESIIVSRKLPEIVDLVLMPSVPPEWRQACLALLLSQETDQELTCRMFNDTVVNASHLPLRVIVDIVQTLSTSVQTPLRMDTRKKLVTTIINQRNHEITAKYVVFFMYQMDELFNMRRICKQQFHKDGQKKPVVQGHEDIKNKDAGKHGKNWSTRDNWEPISTVDSDVAASIMSMNIVNRAASVVSDFKTKDLARIVILLAKWRNRNETLINAVVQRLCQADLSDFNFVQLNNLLFSFSVLNIYKHQVLGQIVSQLTTATPGSPALACTVLTSLSHLRWNDDVLISKCLHYLADHVSELTVNDAHSILMSLANLYIVPKNETETNLVLELAKRAFTEDVTPARKVNCAWCLAILLSLGAELGESLLQPEFVRQFSDDDIQKQTYFHKLCCISTALQYEVRGYSGLLLSEDLVKSVRRDGAGCCDKVMSLQFLECLKMFVDVESYVRLGQTLNCGLIADAVMCASVSGELRPLNVIQDENTYKLAIQLVPFSGVLNLSQSPLGSYSMTARHWKHQGYVPVEILYSDLKPSLSSLEKISNIKRKIQSAIEVFVAGEQGL